MKALQSRRLSMGMLVFLIVLGPVFALLTYFFLAEHEQQRLEARFTQDLKQYVTVLEAELAANLEALYALEALYNSSEQVTRDEFSIYAQSLRRRHPAIYALEWIPRVAARQRFTYEARARRDGLQNYRITERSASGELVRVNRRKHYFPIYYVDPPNVSETTLGLDIASDSERRSVLIEAMAKDTLAITDPVSVGDGSNASTAFLALLPIYKQPAKTFPQRWEQLEGFVLGVFQVQDILQRSLLKNMPDQPEFMAFRLVDLQATGEPVKLFNSLPEGELPPRSPLARRATINFGPQVWELDAYPTADYFSAHRTYRPIIIGVGIFLIWELIMGVLATLIKRAADLEELARKDPLTGLANRRYFVEQVQAEWQRARRMKHPLSVIMIDVDLFKTYNDNHGHRAGDECLQRLADALQTAASRSIDLVSRYGGEEFLILLPNSPSEGAMVVAEKVRAAIEDLAIPQSKASDAAYVTVSLGCATQNKIQTEDGWEQLVGRADAALYQAKQKGRNRFEQAAPID